MAIGRSTTAKRGVMHTHHRPVPRQALAQQNGVEQRLGMLVLGNNGPIPWSSSGGGGG